MAIPEVISAAVDRAKYEGLDSAIDWVWFRCSTPQDRDEFDAWLVSSSHPLSFMAGSREFRFRKIVAELVDANDKKAA